MQFDPRAYFTIVRQIDDHTDTNTYYVRAVIRNSRTDETIDTVDLDDKGSNRFTYAYQLPSDSSGQGLLIDITTSVYTDAGYTTKSPNYGDENAQVLVAQRWQQHLGGVGGVDIDYKKIKKMMEEVVRKRKMQKLPDIPRTDLSPLMVQMVTLQEMIRNFVIPEPEKVDLVPVLQDIANVARMIDNIEIPIPEKPEKLNLGPVLSELGSLKTEILEDLAEKVDNLTKRLENVEKAASKKRPITLSLKDSDVKGNSEEPKILRNKKGKILKR
jgi:hypothetical protein